MAQLLCMFSTYLEWKKEVIFDAKGVLTVRTQRVTFINIFYDKKERNNWKY